MSSRISVGLLWAVALAAALAAAACSPPSDGALPTALDWDVGSWDAANWK
jgi:hypothetical protein